MQRPFDPRIKATFESLTAFDWGDLIRRGLETLLTSARLGRAQLDYSGFGIAKLYIARKSPLDGLLEVYERLEPGQAQANMRAGVCQILEQLRPPPAAETMLIVPELLKFAGAIRETASLTVLERRFAAVDAWRQTADTYHAALQFAYSVETLGGAARLIRAVIGTAKHRSPMFAVTQIRPALRAMVSSEPDQLIQHLNFFDPEVGQAPYEVQEAIASEVFSLRDRTLDESHWMAAKSHFPEWFALALQGVTRDTTQLVRMSVTEVFAEFHAPSLHVSPAAASSAEKRLHRALRAAADISHAALLFALDQVRLESDGRQFPEWAKRAIQPHLEDIDKYLREALQPLLHLQALDRFMLHRVRQASVLRVVPPLPSEGDISLDDAINPTGSDNQFKDGKQ